MKRAARQVPPNHDHLSARAEDVSGRDSIQRFTDAFPCPICGGCDSDARGTGTRCFGYMVDPSYARCTREEFAGGLPKNADETYNHRLEGPCDCGERHDRDPDRARQASNENGSASPTPARRPKIVARYQYSDENGGLAYEVLRYDPKGFKQRRPDGNGGWIWSVKGQPLYLYRLPELKGEKKVYVTEGEDDCKTVHALGLAATTNAMGAGKWRDEYATQLVRAGAEDVVILPDRDTRGERHAVDVARSCLKAGLRVKVVGVPDPYKDVSDAIAGGWTKASLVEAEVAAPLLTVEDLPERPREIGEERPTLTDAGNARRFARRHGAIVRYCYAWRRFLVWDGSRWQPDPGALSMQLAKETARSIYAEAADEPDQDRRKRVAAWAVASESEPRLRAMLELAKSEPGVPVASADLDRDLWLLNVENGTLDLRSGALRPHAQADLITKLAPVRYDLAAKCPRWIALLARIFDGRQHLVDFVQRAIGYSLTGDTSEQCFFMPYGTGANGKSTLLSTVQAMMGDYAVGARPETLMVKGSDSIPNDVARLRGSRLVVTIEAEEGRRLAESLVKQMTGGDVMTARFMRAEFFDFVPAFKLWLATNHKPTVRGTDRAIWRRIRLIPFTVTIPEAERDKHLKEKLRAEHPGILQWAVEGCLAWRSSGLDEPEEVRAATADYRSNQDALGQFISEACVVAPGAVIPVDNLYAEYRAWCESAGERFELTKRAFSDRLTERDGIGRGRLGKQRTRAFIGVQIRSPSDPDPDPDDEADATPGRTQADAVSRLTPKSGSMEVNGKDRPPASAGRDPSAAVGRLRYRRPGLERGESDGDGGEYGSDRA